MPRLVKYAFSRSSRRSAWDAGPPCAQTTYGGSSPSGGTAPGLAGGYTQACTVWPNFPSNSSLRGLGRYPDAGRRPAGEYNFFALPVAGSNRITDIPVDGPPPTPTTLIPPPDRPDANTRHRI